MNDYIKHRQNQKMFGKVPEPKKVYSIPKKSKKKIAEEKEQKESGSDNSMDKWFEERRKELKGKCLFCNSKTEKDNDETYRNSIAHLLPKRPADKGGFPSVATNPENWIELCFYGNSCHTNFDSGKITWEFIKDSKEWEVIYEKLLLILPAVAPHERKNKLYSKLLSLVYGSRI